MIRSWAWHWNAALKLEYKEVGFILDPHDDMLLPLKAQTQNLPNHLTIVSTTKLKLHCGAAIGIQQLKKMSIDILQSLLGSCAPLLL